LVRTLTFATARGLGLHAAHITQKRRVTDGGADRVRVGIAMADDVNRVRRDQLTRG
jgi:hypothetical protein